jgi:hypothetical protein
LYSHELILVNEDRESSKAGLMQVDEQMSHNNEIFLTHQIQMPESILSGDDKVANGKGCVSIINAVSYLPTYQMVAVTFKSGQTLIGKLDLRTFEIGNCLLLPSMTAVKNPAAAQLLSNGDIFHSFREIPHMNS